MSVHAAELSLLFLVSHSVVSHSFTTPWTAAHQVLLSMGFPRQEYWRELPFPSSGDLPNPRSNLCLLHWQADSLPLSHQGSPFITFTHMLYIGWLFLEEWIQALSNQLGHMKGALTDILRSNSGSQGLLECHRAVVCAHTTSDRLAQWGSLVVFSSLPFFFFFSGRNLRRVSIKY